MAVKIASIQNLQQMEVVVAGPDDANRLFIIDGQFVASLGVYSAPTTSPWNFMKEIYSVLVGPVFTRKQFFQANATASFAAIQVSNFGHTVLWQIGPIDADWDDESGQVELSIEVNLSASGPPSGAGDASGASGTVLAAQIQGISFHVTILAAVPAA